MVQYMKSQSHVSNRSLNRVSVLFSVVLSCLAPPVFSQDTSSHTVPLGPFDLEASLLLEYAENDNLYQASEAEIDTSVYTVLPSVGLLFDNGVSGFSLNYALENVNFSDAEDDDFTDQRADLAMGTQFGTFHRIEMTGAWIESHDRQTVADSPSNSEPGVQEEERRLDYYQDMDAQLIYTLGTDRSLFNWLLSAGVYEREYDDNRSVTRAYDREEERLETRLIWNVSPGFRLGLEYSDTDIDYAIANALRDGDEKVSAFSVFWEPVSSVQTELRLGQTERNNDAGDSDTSDYWDISLRWLPLSYSVITLTTSSHTDESGNDDGSFILSESFSIHWAHEWTQRFNTEIRYTDEKRDYLDSAREDDNNSVMLSARYEIKDGISMGVFFEDFERDSNTADGYEQQVYGLNLLFQL